MAGMGTAGGGSGFASALCQGKGKGKGKGKAISEQPVLATVAAGEPDGGLDADDHGEDDAEPHLAAAGLPSWLVGREVCAVDQQRTTADALTTLERTTAARISEHDSDNPPRSTSGSPLLPV